MPIDAKPQAQPIGQGKGGRGVGLDMEKKGGAHSPIPKFFLKSFLNPGNIQLQYRVLAPCTGNTTWYRIDLLRLSCWKLLQGRLPNEQGKA